MTQTQTEVMLNITKEELETTLKFITANFDYSYLVFKLYAGQKIARLEFHVPSIDWPTAEQTKNTILQLWPTAEAKNREK